MSRPKRKVAARDTAPVRDMNQLVDLLEAGASLQVNGKKYGAEFIDHMQVATIREAVAHGKVRMFLRTR